jgi:hypothetical protein
LFTGDFPNHLARHYIGSAIGQSPDLQRFYIYEWWPVPNLAGDVVYAGLSHFFRPTTAERIVVTVGLLLWGFAPFTLYRVVWGNWSVGPSLSAVFLFNASLRGGLENFLIGSALALYGFCLWITWRSHMTWLRVSLFTVATTVVYLSHIVAFALLGLLVVMHDLQKAVGEAGAWKEWLKGLATSALPFLPGVALLLFNGLTMRTTGEFQTTFGGVESRWYVLIAPVLMYHPLPDLLALVTVGGIIAWPIALNPKEAIHRSLHLVLVGLFFACVTAPAVALDIRGLHVRLPTVFATVLIASINWGALTAGRFRVFVFMVAAIMSIRVWSITSYWVQHDAEVAEFREALGAVERGSTLLAAVNPNSDTGEFHWFTASYAVVDRQAFTPSLNTDVHMLSVTAPYKSLAPLIAPPVPLTELAKPVGSMGIPKLANDPFWSEWWKDFEYLIVFSRAPVRVSFERRLHKVAEGSYFLIYKIAKSEAR